MRLVVRLNGMVLLVPPPVTDVAAVATALGLPERTVAEALVRTRDAFEITTMTALAAHSLSTGLRIPPSCATSGTMRLTDG